MLHNYRATSLPVWNRREANTYIICVHRILATVLVVFAVTVKRHSALFILFILFTNNGTEWCFFFFHKSIFDTNTQRLSMITRSRFPLWINIIHHYALRCTNHVMVHIFGISVLQFFLLLSDIDVCAYIGQYIHPADLLTYDNTNEERHHLWTAEIKMQPKGT